MSIKAYKFRVYTNTATVEKLHWVLGRCRELYNEGLQERRDAYEMGERRDYDQQHTRGHEERASTERRAIRGGLSRIALQ